MDEGQTEAVVATAFLFAKTFEPPSEPRKEGSTPSTPVPSSLRRPLSLGDVADAIKSSSNFVASESYPSPTVKEAGLGTRYVPVQMLSREIFPSTGAQKEDILESRSGGSPQESKAVPKKASDHRFDPTYNAVRASELGKGGVNGNVTLLTVIRNATDMHQFQCVHKETRYRTALQSAIWEPEFTMVFATLSSFFVAFHGARGDPADNRYNGKMDLYTQYNHEDPLTRIFQDLRFKSLTTDGGLTYKVNDNNQPVPDDLAQYILLQLAFILHMMERQGVVHRDIKVHNLILQPECLSILATDPTLKGWLENNCKFRLIDWGHACCYEGPFCNAYEEPPWCSVEAEAAANARPAGSTAKSTTGSVGKASSGWGPATWGTPAYSPLETFFQKGNHERDGNWKFESDMFCMGVVAFQILLGVPWYTTTNGNPTIEFLVDSMAGDTKNFWGTWKESALRTSERAKHLSDVTKAFLRGMVSNDAKHRPRAAELIATLSSEANTEELRKLTGKREAAKVLEKQALPPDGTVPVFIDERPKPKKKETK